MTSPTVTYIKQDLTVKRLPKLDLPTSDQRGQEQKSSGEPIVLVQLSPHDYYRSRTQRTKVCVLDVLLY